MILGIFFYQSGCAMLNGLEPRCKNVEEEALGESYAQNGVSVENFDVFARQCAKYSYRVPSKEKFMQGYEKYQVASCKNANQYFRATYQRRSFGNSSKGNCPNSAGALNFSPDDVKFDAGRAYELKNEIDNLNAKIDQAHQNNGKKKYDRDLLVDTLLRAAYESDPASLAEKRTQKTDELKGILSRYNLFISDLR